MKFDIFDLLKTLIDSKKLIIWDADTKRLKHIKGISLNEGAIQLNSENFDGSGIKSIDWDMVTKEEAQTFLDAILKRFAVYAADMENDSSRCIKLRIDRYL